MIILKSDNRVITNSAKYSYLSNNYAAGVSTVTILNYDGFSANDYVLIGNFGSENAEILKIKAVNSGALTFKDSGGSDTNTRFPHSESTKVTILPYNQVEFFYETTPVFTGLTSISGKIDISASDWFSTFSDQNNSTGYGFFNFYNATTAATSAPSNAIPYGGFEYNTVKQSIDNFFSLLNNKELKLINNTEALSWMNEGYSIIYNNLNLINSEFAASAEITLNVTAGTNEYLLPADFCDLVSIVDVDRLPVNFIRMDEMQAYRLSVPRYYIRGKYIGFVPVDQNNVYYYRYTNRAPKLTSYDDIVDLPNDAYYMLKDFMIYRAYQKLKYPNATEYFKIFTNSINDMKIAAIKRSANQDSWDIASYANV